jgi:hypothetical protein
LILDYLIAEGYPTAAERFSKEANLNPAKQQDSVLLRNRIQHDIHLGSIQNAIEAINELNPQVSDNTYFILPPFAMIIVSCTTHIAFGSLMRKTNHTSVLSMSKTQTLYFITVH